MDSHSIWMIVILVLLITLSAYFSATETAFSSLNRIRLKNLAANGNKRTKLAYRLSEEYDELLSTILVGNNIVNITSTSIATMLFIRALGGNGATVSTIIMTVIVLVFGEVTPKSLAKETPESFAIFSAPIIQVFMVILRPINFLFKKLKSLLKRMLHVSNQQTVSDGELLMLVQEAEQEGGINTDEGELLRNAIEFDDITAADILTPRVDIVAIQKDSSKEKIAETFRTTGYSRLPVYEESIDYIIGIIHEKNFYTYVWGTDQPIDSIIKSVAFIPPTIKISSLLRRLQKNKLHMAVAVDEFGGTEGLVTLEDVIEELIGDIWDEHDRVEAESFNRDAEGNYIVYCSTDLDDMLSFFNLHEATDASSINGWIMEHYEKVPEPGDFFDCFGLQFSVREMENNRVLSLSVTGEPLPESFYSEESAINGASLFVKTK